MSRTDAGGLRQTIVAGVVGFLLLAAGGAMVVLVRPATYSSLALVSLDQPSAFTSADDAGAIAKLSRLRQIYGPLLNTTSVTEPIAQATGLTELEVSRRLTALVPKDSLLLGVRGTGTTPAAARKLTEAAAAEIVRYAADSQESAGVASTDEVVLSVVSPARPGVRTTGRPRTVVTVAAFMGLLGAVLGAALRRTRATRADSPTA